MKNPKEANSTKPADRRRQSWFLHGSTNYVGQTPQFSRAHCNTFCASFMMLYLIISSIAVGFHTIPSCA